jgi:hypothetical protein
MDTPNLPPQRPYNPGLNPTAPPPWWHDRVKLFFVIAVGILALAVTGLLLAVLNARGGESAVATATPTPTLSAESPSPSASIAEPTASAEPSSSSDPSPTPSASPDPPQAELSEGWARINTTLNLRNNATEDSAIVVKLAPREVVWVSSSEPYREDIDDDLDWYQVETLNDKYGWIASGSPDDPHATTISNQFKFRTCGSVGVSGRAGLVNGLRTPRLSDAARGTFELGQAMGSRGCMVFDNEDYEPTTKLELDVHACGAPSWDGSVTSLSPTTAGSVDAAWRVPSTIVVPKSLVTERQRVEADGLTNEQKFFLLGSRLASPFLCYRSELVYGKQRHQTQQVEIADCLVITAKDDNFVTFDPSKGDPVTFRRSNRYRDNINGIAVNDAARLRLNGSGGSLKVSVLGDC